MIDMRHIVALAFGACLAGGAVADALAKPAYVASTLNLRAAPGTTSEIVGKIPGGSLVDAGECTEGWCAVTWQEKSGFTIESALDLSGRVPPRRTVVRRPVYVDEPPIYYEVPPPPYYARPYPYYFGAPYYRRHYHRRYWGHRW
jgi:uncharacterized protein YraI